MSVLESEERQLHDGRRGEVPATSVPATSVPQEAGISSAPISLLPAVERAVAAAQRHLLELQQPDGHWCAELEGDAILESEYILTLYFLGRGGEARLRKAANTLRATQLPEGGWSLYPGGPPDVNPTVKGYFALKLLGDAPEAAHMVRAREAARRLGGIDACNSFTKIYLAIFGQVDWDDCPAVPPELILFPTWFPFNVYEMSSWSRAIVVPLSLIWALRPSCPVPPEAGIAELRVPGAAVERKRGVWTRIFLGLDLGLKLAEKGGLRPFRRLAIERAEDWIRQRLEASDGLGAIFPPIINAIFAFRALGYPVDHPLVAGQVRELERLEKEDDDALWLQPCFSPVWDTALALNALLESGLPADDRRAREAARWLVEREVRRPGDWQVKAPATPAGGWYFEYANEFYPDCDDTAQVITALSKVDLPPEEAARRDEVIGRAVQWLLGMQCSSGGWASFDKDCDREFLTYIPFADHNAMIDPPTVDVSSRVLEALMAAGTEAVSPAVRRAVRFVLAEQEADGSWYGRWGCNYLYGTWLAATGLAHAGERAPEAAWVARARSWLVACQNADGGWGELPASYADPMHKGRGPSTASQTAWALMGLLACGERGEILARGVRYLLATQREDGGWQDEFWTGTGFPEVFYLRYHLYATYFPLLALALWRRAQEGEAGSSSPKLSA